ncbi:NADPH-adrenodoxin reductase [Mortierella claussenii]|nr:NADPH-adrenodoxin reductase [Mortierella claussenii]
MKASSSSSTTTTSTSTSTSNPSEASITIAPTDTTTAIDRTGKPFRVAVIGSGPGGFYTAHRILRHVPEAKIDMFEALPVPHGLVRFGVAPDHPEVKNVINTFDEVAQNPDFTFIGNTSVGTFTSSSSSSSSTATTTPLSKSADLEISDLKPHYDSIVLAYGAHEDRLLGVPNETTLTGVMAARSFVGFYNGLPSEQDLDIDLSTSDTAVVIGQGNVALDVARILLTPLEDLKRTDLTEKMIRILEKSAVKHVHVIGRRGPLEVAFTAKELREMLQLPQTTFNMDADLLKSEMDRAGKTLDRPRKRLMGLLEKGIKESKPGQPKSWSLKFLRSPLGFQGNTAVTAVTGDEVKHAVNQRLKAIDLGVNRLEGENNARKAVATGEKETLECGLAFRSIGYKSVGVKGIPFDERKGIVPNVDGKVLDAEQNIVPGLYAAGWLKRGPIGVIATTMADAYQTGDTIIADWTSGQPMLNQDRVAVSDSASGSKKESHVVLDMLRAKGHRTVSYQDWKKIEQKEFDLGAALGKPREKLLTVEEMLKVLD